LDGDVREVASRTPMSGADAIQTAIAAPSGGMVRVNTGLAMIAETRPSRTKLAMVPRVARSQNRRSSVERIDGRVRWIGGRFDAVIE
jgi:hypothetical protein